MAVFRSVPKRWIAIGLLICVLFCSVCVLCARGDWLFYIAEICRIYPDVALTEVETVGTEWRLSDLMQAPNVSVANTLMLVNSTHPLPEDYEAVIEDYNDAEMHPLMIDAYVALRDTVEKNTGVRLRVSDDYRTKEEQSAILAEKGGDIAAAVGCSEHEAGLALDVYVKGYGGLAFLHSYAGREVNRICGDYGYIIRYPLLGEDLTGITFEPWHLRYVGLPHSAIIENAGLTLEEYIAVLTPDVWFAHEEYRILRTASETVTLPDGWQSCHVSEDNTGHWIITLKMS